MARRRRKGGPAKGQGGGGRRHPASLANLRQGLPVELASRAGQAMTHGFRSAGLVKDVEREVRELMDALAEGAPVREADGSVPLADVAAIEAAARALKRWRHVSRWCDLHGRLDDKGEVRSAARYEVTAENQLQRALDSLGVSPMARSKLGLNIARSAGVFDLARQWQEDGDE